MVVLPSTWQWTYTYPIRSQDYDSNLAVVVKSGVGIGFAIGPTGFTAAVLTDTTVKGLGIKFTLQQSQMFQVI